MPRLARITRLLAAILAACGRPGPLPPAASRQGQALDLTNGRELNGRKLNGRELNGRELNGRELNGRELNGVSLGGATLHGAALGNLWLVGSELQGSAPDGSVLAGADLVGATLLGGTDDGAFSLRLDAAAPDPDPGNTDLWLYTVSFQRGGQWRPLCGTDASGAPVAALALAGRWVYHPGPQGGDHLSDPQQFTFACLGYALSKCVEVGYKPWLTVQRCENGACAPYSLAAYHQACTRLLRADYCGDGRSFTQDGTLLNLYDDVGIQQDTEGWAFEAEWTPNGARCLSRPRLPGTHLPDCARDLLSPSCGQLADFAAGALLMDEDAN